MRRRLDIDGLLALKGPAFRVPLGAGRCRRASRARAVARSVRP